MNESAEKKPLTSFEIPVQIFILFLVRNQTDFTVNDTIKEFQEKHGIELTYNRMNQILNQFVSNGNLKKAMKANGQKGKLTAYYSFESLE